MAMLIQNLKLYSLHHNMLSIVGVARISTIVDKRIRLYTIRTYIIVSMLMLLATQQIAVLHSLNCNLSFRRQKLLFHHLLHSSANWDMLKSQEKHTRASRWLICTKATQTKKISPKKGGYIVNNVRMLKSVSLFCHSFASERQLNACLIFFLYKRRWNLFSVYFPPHFHFPSSLSHRK